ncbi:hypothetical protein Pse7367_3934 (plasmid) [Thalassoporum mexicanum PCC 7367]|uniref:hypothetical protein n=1 Tax=Thalassoporum mexicanum TaxID=3457544 RepID=UPI00029F928A|nr:hypothetical protein [Pseudanabaena sp. PCC 7367]AFY72150.1 hypothetical protein Pse7367_3934 [Pseudanabaena sp. PCC 7367]
MYTSLLQTAGLLACHCRISPETIQAGILIVTPEFRSPQITHLPQSISDGEATLIDLDSENTYQVTVPDEVGCFYDVELQRIPA